jgi:hypothetical protein
MKIVLYVLAGLIGLYLLYLLLRRPVYAAPVNPYAAAQPGGVWGAIGSLLGAGIGTAVATSSKAKPQSSNGVLVVGQGYPGSGNSGVVYMPSANYAAQSNLQARSSGSEWGIGDAAGSGSATGSDWYKQMIAEGYSAEELAAYA